MDSLSQIALGASVAHLALGSRLGRGALLLGAGLGTLPDLDVLIPYDGAIENFTYHRGFSHSVFVLTLASLPIAWVCQRLWRAPGVSYANWLLGCWLVLITHPILDGFTMYGTQLLWPLSPPPTAWGSVFIIDPVYTLPLVIGVVMAYRRTWKAARPFIIAGLALSSAYLAWTLFAQHQTRQWVKQELNHRQIVADRIVIAPFPFSLLWRIVVITESDYMEGYSSLPDRPKALNLTSYDNGKQTCSGWLNHGPIKRLDWFTQGAFSLSAKGNVLIATDLRMGIEDDYVFEFEIAEWSGDSWQAIVNRQRAVDIDGQRMALLFRRMVDANVNLLPARADPVPLPLNCDSV